MLIRLVLSVLILLIGIPCYALTTYYVDPTYTGGSNDGSAAAPWTALGNAGAWTAINGALASDDVTIYFSARIVGSDTAENMGGDILLTSRTDTSTHVLTIDGKSQYNTNDSSGSWSAYSGSNKMIARKINLRKASAVENTPSDTINYCTVTGFTITQTTGDKALEICGSHVTITYCDISHSGAGVTNGPLVQFAPTADGPHEGSTSPCPSSTNFTFSNNNLSNSYGELLYLGGGGSNIDEGRPPGAETWAACGYPGHSDFTITNNTFTTGGAIGAQGDGIDIKGGHKNFTISGNTFSNMSDAETRAIIVGGWQADDTTTNQNIVIEKNYFHDNSNWYETISLSNNWGGCQGVTIRNNVFDSNAAEGIRIYTDADGATYFSSKWIYIYNNTFYNQASYAIQTDSGSQITASEIKNNLFIDNNSSNNQVTWAGSITESNNAYSDTFGETCTLCQTVTAADVVDAANANFNIAAGSVLIDNGATIATFSDDYSGTSRPQGAAWDIGAYEVSDTTAPANPTYAINTAGSSFTVTFSEAVTHGAGGTTGWVLTSDGGAVTATYSSGAGSTALVYTLSRIVISTETVTGTYTQPTAGITDIAGNEFATVTDEAITNNSTATVETKILNLTGGSHSMSLSGGSHSLSW